MSPFVKQILFMVTGIFLIGLIGVYNETAQRLLGLFAFGWLLADIASAVFPSDSK